MTEDNTLIDDSERTHKTNIKMKRRLSFHHTNAATNNTLENALQGYSEHAIPNLNAFNLETKEPVSQPTLNDKLVLSYLDTEHFNYNVILTDLLLNKNRSKTETLSIFTTIIEQIDEHIKNANKKLTQELSDSILQNLIVQIKELIKENKGFGAEFQRLDKKLQSLISFINTKKYNQQSSSHPGRNGSKRISSINSAGGQRVVSMVSGFSVPHTPRLMTNSSSPDLWDNFNANGTRNFSNSGGLRSVSTSSLDLSDKGLVAKYDLLLQRRQFDMLFDFVLENRKEENIVLKYEQIVKDKIISELCIHNRFGNPVSDDLLLKKYIGQLKKLESGMNLLELFFLNRKNKLYSAILNENMNDVTRVLLTLEYISQVVKLFNEIFGVQKRQNIALIKFVQETLSAEFLDRKGKVNEEKKYEDLIRSYFDKYEKEYNLNFFYILDDFKYQNEDEDSNQYFQNDYSFDNTNETSYDLSGEDVLV